MMKIALCWTENDGRRERRDGKSSWIFYSFPVILLRQLAEDRWISSSRSFHVQTLETGSTLNSMLMLCIVWLSCRCCREQVFNLVLHISGRLCRAQWGGVPASLQCVRPADREEARSSRLQPWGNYSNFRLDYLRKLGTEIVDPHDRDNYVNSYELCQTCTLIV